MRQPRKPREPRAPRRPRGEWKPYIELLRDPRWQKMRLQILERDKWTCANCGETTKTLHVHHQRYERGKMPWEVSADYLLTLCEGCHETATIWRKEIDAALADVDPSRLARIAGYIQGQALDHSPTGLSDVPVLDHEQACGIMDAAYGSFNGEAVIDAAMAKGDKRFDRDDFSDLQGELFEQAHKLPQPLGMARTK